MSKSKESLTGLMKIPAGESEPIDVEYTSKIDAEKAIKEFKESLIEFTVAVTKDIKNISKGGDRDEPLIVLSGDDKIFDRALKILERQEILIKVLRFDPEPEKQTKKERSRVSVETMAK